MADLPRIPRIPLLRPGARTPLYQVTQDHTVLTTDLDGWIMGHPDQGLYVQETRMLCRYRYLIDGQPPRPIALGNVEQHSWLGYYITDAPGVREDPCDQGGGKMGRDSVHTLELRLSRYVGPGIHEDVDLTNYSLQPTTFTLVLEVDADFADHAEAAGERFQHGELTTNWNVGQGGSGELIYDYRAEHAYQHQDERGVARLHRGLALRVHNAGSPPTYQDGRLAWRVALPPGGSWHACLELVPVIEEREMPPSYGCGSFPGTDNRYDSLRRSFLARCTAFEIPAHQTLAPVVVEALEQAKRDLAGLRLHNIDHGDHAWTVAAGIPIYVAIFGRDALTTAWQAGLVSDELMRGSLLELARLQGREVNHWRDEQPGKMLHEAHLGPLPTLGYDPRCRYYGALTTSCFYPFAVAALWHWTGDKALVRPLLQPALKALHWLDTYGDPDGDGFYEYRSRSEQGTKNQGWKDSTDAIVYEDGTRVQPPIAPCPEQCFVYVAKLHLSELLWWMGDKDNARRLFHQAGELKKRFNDAFWLEDEGLFALGLDPDKRPIRSAGSDSGHALATGIADTALAGRIAARLMAEDMFSGWGVRTLSAHHAAYNPYSYHRGSVWPVEHGTFALGFMRYGLHELNDRLCRAMFEAAALFAHCRLPEVFSGHPRDAYHPFPALYPGACWPQAWSSSAVFCMLQSLLGLYPYAPLNALVLDPHLPEWLPEITLRGLRVGQATATIHFFRRADGTSDYRILDAEGALQVLRQPSPWSLSATLGERLWDGLASLLPGR